jgi:GTP cyclohydrolase I
MIPEDKVLTEDRIRLAARYYEMFMEILDIPLDANSKDTSMRVAKMMVEERCKSLYCEPPKLTFFPKDGYDEYIAVKDIPYYSFCAHHHVSFYGKAHICYHPKDHIVGLSKLARVVTYFSQKPQIQEIMTSEIINYLWDTLAPRGIMVKVEGTHLCMCSRGAKAVGSITRTQQILGEIDKGEVAKLFE